MPDEPVQRNFVSGSWTESETGETFATVDPATDGDVVARYQRSNAADAARAVEAAAAASDAWADTPGPERGRVLTAASRALADRKAETVHTLVREEGKTRSEAAGEVQRAIDIFEYYGVKARDLGGTVKAAGSRSTDLYTVTEPLGVAGLITPWNYPIAIPAWKLAPALAAGNAAVLHPASEAPGVVFELVEALEAAGLPHGVVNVVTGPGSEVGETITTHEGVDAVSFTGSARVGARVHDAATEGGKRVQLEMGGKNPTVVTEHADLGTAAEVVAAGAFGVTGQACTATSRAIVHDAVYDAFVDRLLEHAAAIEVGPGLDDPDMGPHVNDEELGTTLEYVDIGQAEGATLAGGGQALGREGQFVEPTVFTDVDSGMRIAHEEIFGPVVAVMRATGFDEAVDVANDVKYGLAASVVTDDHTEANRFVDEIEAGVVKVNEPTTGVELHVPFGGTKASSSETYREQGDQALEFYTTRKTVYERY